MTIHGLTLVNPELGWTPAANHVRLWDCGVTWRHINIAPNTYDWARLDYIVDGLRANGTTNISYVFGGTPLWHAKDPNLPYYAPWLGPGSNSQPIDNTHWQAFCIAIATRYLGKIGSYELWNEPQLKDFWGYDNWDALAEMHRIANNAIHSVSPGLKTISGAIVTRASSGGFTRGGNWYKALKAKSWPGDIYSAHMYPEIGYTPGRVRTYAENWNAKLLELAAPTKPKWITEINYNLFGGVLNDATIIDYMNRTETVCNDEGIYKCYWYCQNHTDPNLLGIPFTPGSQGMITLDNLTP